LFDPCKIGSVERKHFKLLAPENLKALIPERGTWSCAWKGSWQGSWGSTGPVVRRKIEPEPPAIAFRCYFQWISDVLR